MDISFNLSFSFLHEGKNQEDDKGTKDPIGFQPNPKEEDK